MFSENVYRDTWSLFAFCLFASVVGLPLPLPLKTWNIKPKSRPLSAQLLFLCGGGSMSLWTWWHPLPDRNKNKKLKRCSETKGKRDDRGHREKGSHKRCQTVWIQPWGLDTMCQDSKAEGGKKMCEYPWAWSLFLWPWAPCVYRGCLPHMASHLLMKSDGKEGWGWGLNR